MFIVNCDKPFEIQLIYDEIHKNLKHLNFETHKNEKIKEVFHS